MSMLFGLDFVYGLDGQLLAETAATGEALVEYVWMNGRPLAMLSQDRDKDGVPDELDNCIDRPNGPLQPDNGGFSQRDTDGDGYGNYCDPDLNNDGLANSMDLGIMVSVFFTNDANADFNGDGIVNSLDLGVMSQLFSQPPGPSGPNGDASPAGPRYIHTDHLGTPVAMTDSTGATVWNAVYDPFGSAAIDNDPDGDGVTVVNNLRFPGQYYDQETGLHYNYFRTYDPSTGRYLTADPIGQLGGVNLYPYVFNNPVNRIDPDGQNPLVIIGIGAIVGGGASFFGTLLGDGSLGGAFESIPGGALQGAIITLGGIGSATAARLGIGFILGLGSNLITVSDVIADDSPGQSGCN